MRLNKLFLGDNTVVDIKTSETLDEIKFKLASRYDVSKRDPTVRLPFENDDFAPGYVFFMKGDALKIYFSNDVNRKVGHSFSLIYPYFTARITDNGDRRIIKGAIGLPEWTYISVLLFPFILAVLFFIKLTQEEIDGIDIPLYAVSFSFIISLVNLYRTKNKAREMAEEIDRVFSNLRVGL